jgi:hypothetical protein
MGVMITSQCAIVANNSFLFVIFVMKESRKLRMKSPEFEVPKRFSIYPGMLYNVKSKCK